MFNKLIMFIGVAAFLLNSQLASASVIDDYGPKIKSACVDAGLRKKGKTPDLKAVCSCVATTHVASAKQEPNEAEALRQLDWLIRYYSAADRAEQKRVLQDPDSIFDYDMDVVQDCLETVRGK